MFMMHRGYAGALAIDTEVWRPTGMRACVVRGSILTTAPVEENLFSTSQNFRENRMLARSNFKHGEWFVVWRGRCTTRFELHPVKARRRGDSHRQRPRLASKICSMPSRLLPTILFECSHQP